MPSMFTNGSRNMRLQWQLVRLLCRPAVLFIASLTFGNMAYVYMSVSLVQMIKATTPAIVLIVSCLFGLETFMVLRFGLVFLCCIGAACVGVGDIHSSFLGFVYQGSALGSEALRLVLLKAVVSLPKVDELTLLSVQAPLCFLLLLGPVLALEWQEGILRGLCVPFFDDIIALLLNGVLAIVLNVSSLLTMRQLPITSYALLGLAKDVVIVSTGSLIFGKEISHLQMIGFLIVMVSSQTLTMEKRGALDLWLGRTKSLGTEEQVNKKSSNGV